MKQKLKLTLAGLAAGAINGLFGAGGGMILVPLLSSTDLPEEQIFQSSVSIIFPVCIVSLAIYATGAPLPLVEALPYLLGGLAGGFIAGKTGNKIPVKWLHRILGGMIIWGGVRYLC